MLRGWNNDGHLTALAVALFAAAAMTAGGCKAVEEYYDCAYICSEYQNCVDDSYDVRDCTDRCEDRADEDEDFADRADSCQTCIDDRSCAEQSVACAVDCAGIVP
jgi:hypothetical protein